MLDALRRRRGVGARAPLPWHTEREDVGGY